ncbi:MAG: sulfatase-like hydrolase/transferase [Propionibacteriales bacterium]|nr:sulfatase-like hydrolase/transferase [Propionibacteriales bacterium]
MSVRTRGHLALVPWHAMGGTLRAIALLVVGVFGLATACESAASSYSPRPERERGFSVSVVPPQVTGHRLPVPWDTPKAFRSPRVYERLRQPTGPAVARPNVVLITTDDQTLEEMRAMPKTRELFGTSGVIFDQGISPNPLCCPARASILTGQFSHNHGVRTNFAPHGGYRALDSADTLPVWLRDAGYRTAFLGKYLNGYGRSRPDEIPPGWDIWRGAALGTRHIHDYYDTVLSENGQLRRYPRSYLTDLYADKSVRLIRRFAESRRPFFLWQSHVAPHGGCRSRFGWDASTCWHPPEPAYRHMDDFAEARFPGRFDPPYDEADVSDKPASVRNEPALDADRRERTTRLMQRRLQSLEAVDDAVIRTAAALDKAGVLDETLIVFASDNGFLLGEHRTFGKNIGYEPALRVPLMMRGPGLPSGTRTNEVATLVDLAPTILAATGVEPGLRMDGRHLLPVAKGRRPGWSTVLLQGGPNADDDTGAWRFVGVRSTRYTYLELRQTGEVELYDRRRDPRQLRNVAENPAYDVVEREMRRRLGALEHCAGTSCRRDFGTEPTPSGPPVGLGR